MSYSCSGDKNYSLYNETQPKQVIMIDEHDSVSILFCNYTTLPAGGTEYQVRDV